MVPGGVPLTRPTFHFSPWMSAKASEHWRRTSSTNICDGSSSIWQETMPAAFTHRCGGPTGLPGQRCSATQEWIEQSIMLSKHHSAVTQAAGCWHLDSSEDAERRKTSAMASAGFNWLTGQKESSASTTKVDAWRVIKSESTGWLQIVHFWQSLQCN